MYDTGGVVAEAGAARDGNPREEGAGHEQDERQRGWVTTRASRRRTRGDRASPVASGEATRSSGCGERGRQAEQHRVRGHTAGENEHRGVEMESVQGIEARRCAG